MMWSEDWMYQTGSSWGNGLVQRVGFLVDVLRAAGSKHNLPVGFYNTFDNQDGLAQFPAGKNKEILDAYFTTGGIPRADAPTLLVLDGAKALHAAVKRVWGQNALIQRCQVHKTRNVREHLPQKHWEELSRQLGAAYHETDYDQALKALKTTARWLERLNPDAAASLREGMEETLTVVRLGVPELLRRTLATTNPIESAFSVAENVTRRVKCWREGDMRQRWCIAGLIRAESKFRRVKGHRHMAQLLKALDRLPLGKGLDKKRKIA
jgi:hypothetical protein